MKYNPVRFGVLILMIALATILVLQWKAEDPHISSIKTRANRIFLSAKQGHPIPSNQLISLSVALQFHNYQGAEIIIKKLEKNL